MARRRAGTHRTLPTGASLSASVVAAGVVGTVEAAGIPQGFPGRAPPGQLPGFPQPTVPYVLQRIGSTS